MRSALAIAVFIMLIQILTLLLTPTNLIFASIPYGGSITIRVHNLMGYRMPLNGGLLNVTIVKWNSTLGDFVVVDSKVIAYGGDVEYVNVTFTNLELNERYYFSVYNTPHTWLKMELVREFWGGGSFILTTSNSSTTLDFHRETPYIKEVSYNLSTSSNEISLNTTVENRYRETLLLALLLILDRDLKEPYDVIQTSESFTMSPNETKTIKVNLKAPEPGRYISYIVLLPSVKDPLKAKWSFDQHDGSWKPIEVVSTPSLAVPTASITIHRYLQVNLSNGVDSDGDGLREYVVEVSVPSLPRYTYMDVLVLRADIPAVSAKLFDPSGREISVTATWDGHYRWTLPSVSSGIYKLYLEEVKRSSTSIVRIMTPIYAIEDNIIKPFGSSGAPAKWMSYDLYTSIDEKGYSPVIWQIEPQVVTVDPGQEFDLRIKFTIRQFSYHPPEIIWQVFLVYSWSPTWPPPEGYYYALYDGIPSYEGETVEKTVRIKAPDKPGEYYIYVGMRQHYGMKYVLEELTRKPDPPAHAKIIVKTPTTGTTSPYTTTTSPTTTPPTTTTTSLITTTTTTTSPTTTATMAPITTTTSPTTLTTTTTTTTITTSIGTTATVPITSTVITSSASSTATQRTYVGISSISVSSSIVSIGDSFDVYVAVGVSDVLSGTKALVSIDAPDFDVLVGSDSRVLQSQRTDFRLRLRATKEGEHRVEVKLYLLNNSTPLEVDSKSVVVKVLSKSKLTIEIYDIIFRTPIDDAEVSAIPIDCPSCIFTLPRTRENIYEAYLPKTTYDIIVNNHKSIKLLYLNEDKIIILQEYSKLSIAVLIILIITSFILLYPVSSFNENLALVLGITQGIIASIIFGLMMTKIEMLEPFIFLVIFIYHALFSVSLSFYVVFNKVRESISAWKIRKAEEEKSRKVSKAVKKNGEEKIIKGKVEREEPEKHGFDRSTREGEEAPRDFRGYRLLELVGRGGFADVYRALDKNGGVVALKIYRGSDKAFVEEVGNIVQLTKRLNLPYVVRVLDYGVKPKPFIVMDFYPTNLRYLMNRVRKGGVDFEKLLKLMIRVARALAYAHSRGVFHGDLKPENILVYEEEGEYYPAVADWGGGFTPGYSAPEVYESGGRDLSGKSDVWSFGAILYEILKGKKLFRDPLEYDAYVRSGRDLSIDLAGDLKNIVEKCLARNPAKRPSMNEVVAELEEQLVVTVSSGISSKSKGKLGLEPKDAMQLINTYVYTRRLKEAEESLKYAESRGSLKDVVLIYNKIVELRKLFEEYSGSNIPRSKVERIYNAILEVADKDVRKKLEEGRYSLRTLLQAVGDSIPPELHEVFRECLDYINDIITIHYMRLST